MYRPSNLNRKTFAVAVFLVISVCDVTLPCLSVRPSSRLPHGILRTVLRRGGGDGDLPRGNGNGSRGRTNSGSRRGDRPSGGRAGGRPTGSPSLSPDGPARRPREPCRFFLWDGASATKFAVCRSLLRRSMYEGRGGKKFIRTPPGSVLDSLYPCADHSPNSCVVCGRTFQEHLNAWWDRRGDGCGDYDRHLTNTYVRAREYAGNGTVAGDDDTRTAPRGGGRGEAALRRRQTNEAEAAARAPMCSGVSHHCGDATPVAFSGLYFAQFRHWIRRMESDTPLPRPRALMWYVSAPVMWRSIVRLRKIDEKENNCREYTREDRSIWGP